MTIAAYDAAKTIQHLAPESKPIIAIVLGSGLGELANHIEDPTIISYDDIPGFHTPAVEGHGGKLYLGKIHGLPVACLQGRPHYYEGIPNVVLKTVVRTMSLLGCKQWLATNASGSMRIDIETGSLVLVNDHINLQFTNALVGENDDDFGPRFVGMEDAYDPEIREQFKKIAKQLTIDLHEGIYIGVLGPSFETPAEIKAFRILGADLVGMSTVGEVIVARHCDMRVGVISVVTNMAAGMTSEKIMHDVALSVAHKASKNLIELILAYIETLK